jgi:transaldolase
VVAGRPAQPADQDPGRVNVTLILVLQRYVEVVDVFLDGMERAGQAGHDLSSMASVASFFVSRLDTEIDVRLDKIGTVRLAQHHEQVFSGARWAAL